MIRLGNTVYKIGKSDGSFQCINRADSLLYSVELCFSFRLMTTTEGPPAWQQTTIHRILNL